MSSNDPFERFLETHRPVPPAAPANELAQLNAKLRAAPRRAGWGRTVAAAAIAAAVLAVSATVVQQHQHRQQSREVAAFIEESFTSIEDDNDMSFSASDM